MTRAILHIGTVKTGSSALQSWLGAHSDLLAKHDYLYSQAAGPGNHIKLAAYAQDDDTRDDLRARLGIRSAADLTEFRARLATELDAEFRANAGRTFLFSNEHCHVRLLEPREIERLYALLAPLFDAIAIVIYIRRQDELAVSGYTTALTGGDTREEVIDPKGANVRALDYHTTLGRWAETFGEQNLAIRIYDEAMRASGSIVQNFCTLLGFEAPSGPTPRINSSLSPPYQEFLRQMNMLLPRPVDGQANPARGDLARYLAKFGAGRGRVPSRAETERFYALFRESNEAARRRWFPDRATLFDEDFDRYPETSHPVTLDERTLLSIFAEIWGEASRERSRLLDQIARIKKTP